MKSKTKPVLITVVILSFALLSFLFYVEGSLPVDNKNPRTKIFIIEKGESLNNIARNLEKEGLVRNKIIFIVIVKRLGIEKNIQAGDFRLSTAMDTQTIANRLTQGSLDVWITTIEGWRKEEIAQLLSRELGIPEIEFINQAGEGYMFPDTYLIPRDATAETVVSIMRANFDRKYTDQISTKALKLGLTKQQVITLASIVEKEARGDDRKTIASILLRRMREGHKLQADATVQYALGYQPQEKRWWKKEVNLSDLRFDSPYNTYQIFGLPPAPIGNPGLASIEAVVNADPNTPYLFYIHDKKGKAHFGRNSEEHQKNINKYL